MKNVGQTTAEYIEVEWHSRFETIFISQNVIITDRLSPKVDWLSLALPLLYSRPRPSIRPSIRPFVRSSDPSFAGWMDGWLAFQWVVFSWPRQTIKANSTENMRRADSDDKWLNWPQSQFSFICSLSLYRLTHRTLADMNESLSHRSSLHHLSLQSLLLLSSQANRTKPVDHRLLVYISI